MPELPEVESVRLTLLPKILNQSITQVRVGLAKLARPEPQIFAKGLMGREIKDISRRGKLLAVELSGSAWLTIHLGMTGRLMVADAKPLLKHIHVEIYFAGGQGLFFHDMRRFGAMAYYGDTETYQQQALARLGPDALSIAPEEFCSRLACRSAPIKSMLLDQRVLAGIGNIYADESLHLAGISPLARPSQLSAGRLKKLHKVMVQTLHKSLALGGSSVKDFVDAEGKQGSFQEMLQVYRRSGQPCLKCGRPIERIVLGGRSTHYCPACQKN